MKIRRIAVLSVAQLLLISCMARNPVKHTAADLQDKNRNYCGIVVSRVVDGPPGYGETPDIDVKREIFVLKLDDNHVFSTTNVSGKKQVVREIQLTGRDIDFKDFLNNKICVRGMIHEQSSSFEYLPYVIEVEYIPFIAPSKM